MNDALGVSGFERVGDLSGNTEEHSHPRTDEQRCAASALPPPKNYLTMND